MAFTRSFLKSIGLTDEQISAALEEHTNVTKYLQGQIDQHKADADKYKADAERLPTVQKELDDLKGRKDYKPDYDRAVQELADFKAQAAKDAEEKEVRQAFKALLDKKGIDPKRHDAIMRVTDFSTMKRDKDGNLEGADKLEESSDKEWSAFKVTARQRGENVPHPPADTGSPKPTVEQIMAIKDTAERQKAIAANHELFGF